MERLQAWIDTMMDRVGFFPFLILIAVLYTVFMVACFVCLGY